MKYKRQEYKDGMIRSQSLPSLVMHNQRRASSKSVYAAVLFGLPEAVVVSSYDGDKSLGGWNTTNLLVYPAPYEVFL